MEITFSDKKTINREIVISGDEANEPDLPEETKMPWVIVAVLVFIVCASLATGIHHWYSAYFNQADALQPAYVETETNPDTPPETPPETVIVSAEEDEPDEIEDATAPRYEIEPLPEFLQLWDEYGNNEVVAVLTLGDTEIPVVQGNNNAFYITHDINRDYSSLGWVFLDSEVDLLTGMEQNMVIYDPVGGFLRQILQEYAGYDFFLMHPTITLFTLYGEFEWEIFSFYTAPAEFPFATVNHPDEDSWGEMLEQFTLASQYNTRLDVNMFDQILTIAVPTGINPEYYYILQARMLRQITS